MRKVEKELGLSAESTSSLPRNTQQAATIRRNLFQDKDCDPIMALIDLHKTDYSHFIRSLQLLPTPACILATDEQLHQLVLNCTQEVKFGVMHLDPTFNLGEFFVTPIVFPLVNYVHRKSSGGCPSFIGPVLLHHQMQQSTYSYFLNQIISLKPSIRNVKAFGTDGELALSNALKEHIPGAVALRCLKHIRDSIERKLNDLKYNSQGTSMIVSDIFGSIVDGVRELGLSDATNEEDFFAKLMSLENKWNSIEKSHRCFLASEKKHPVFYEWFCSNHSNVFTESVIQCVRERAGLGKPPEPFYNNRSESINKLIKHHVHYKKNSLPAFVKHLYTLIEEQSNSMMKASKQIGNWRLRDQSGINPTNQLSCSSELLQSCTIDREVLDSIWEKAAYLVHSRGYITPIPGDAEGKGRMVASSSMNPPHMITAGRKNDSVFLCDRTCPRYAAYKFCSHTIAVAEVNGCLKDFIKELQKAKITPNMTKLAYHGLKRGAGEKGGKAKPKRKRPSSLVSDLPVRDRLSQNIGSTSMATMVNHPVLPPAKRTNKTGQQAAGSESLNLPQQNSLITTSIARCQQQQQLTEAPILRSPSAQPYIFKVLTASIKVCAGCRLGYNNRSPPFDVCLVHQETRSITNPLTHLNMTVPVNAHYHASASCIRMKNPSFTGDLLIIPAHLKDKMCGSSTYKALILQEFGVNLL